MGRSPMSRSLSGRAIAWWALVPGALSLAIGCSGTDSGGGSGVDDRPDSGVVTPDSGIDGGIIDSGAVDSGVATFGPVQVDVDAAPPSRLSDFQFFRYLGDEGTFEYNDRVVAYALTTPLFSDFTLKERAIYIPPGETITYTSTGTLELPVGSAVIKTFLVADDLTDPGSATTIVETRVLIRGPEDWRPYPYIWRADGSDADLVLGGRAREFTFVDPYGASRTAQYLIPSRNQCFECHEIIDETDEEATTLIGPKARYLNRDNTYDGETVNQLTYLEDLGLLTGLPPLSEVEAAFDIRGLVPSSTQTMDGATLNRATRDYLDINCAHCHSPTAREGVTSQFFLNYDNEDQFRLGVCKQPGSAGGGSGGRPYDIVPGDPEQSILVYRTETEIVGDMMPLIGRSLADDLGVALVRAWVAAMPPQDCD